MPEERDVDSRHACDVSMKATPRDERLKRDLECRINRAIGQLGGIKSMVEEDRYCGDVLTQLAAVESAVKAISREVMRDHLQTCVVERIQAGDTEVTDEVMRLFKKFM
nr:metal-sensing transcriptional repressor [uncultured Olsenella sp.]